MSNMKAFLLSDVHLGLNTRGKRDFFFDETETFILDVVESNPEIKHMYILGDLFDIRSTLDIVIMNRTIELFDKLQHLDIKILLGNHDCYYNSTNSINSVKWLERIYPNITLIDNYLIEEDKSLLMVEWVNDENRDLIENKINNSGMKYLFGHFDVIGAEVAKGIPATKGYPSDYFYMYDKVISGHYHLINSIDNVHYIGNPMQTTFMDAGEKKRIIIFDFSNGEIESVYNPRQYFIEVDYHEKILESGIDFKDKFVKLNIDLNDDDLNRITLNKTIDTIRDVAHELVVQQVMRVKASVDDQEIIKTTSDTREFITNYCAVNGITENVEEYLTSLHDQSIESL